VILNPLIDTYLLRGKAVTGPDQVWSADITWSTPVSITRPLFGGAIAPSATRGLPLAPAALTGSRHRMARLPAGRGKIFSLFS
jgi:hypothetical protein